MRSRSARVLGWVGFGEASDDESVAEGRVADGFLFGDVWEAADTGGAAVGALLEHDKAVDGAEPDAEGECLVLPGFALGRRQPEQPFAGVLQNERHGRGDVETVVVGEQEDGEVWCCKSGSVADDEFDASRGSFGGDSSVGVAGAEDELADGVGAAGLTGTCADGLGDHRGPSFKGDQDAFDEDDQHHQGCGEKADHEDAVAETLDRHGGAYARAA